MKKIFIGGSRNISRLNEQIKERLLNIINNNYFVLIGDANGADRVVQQFLNDIKYENVLVHCSGVTCRNNVGNWETEKVEVSSKLNGIKYYMAKDKKMAEEAEYGFMLWDGKSAGTLNNILNLLKENKKTLVYYSPLKQFFIISSLEDINSLISKCDQSFIDKIKKKINLNKSILEISGRQQLQMGF